MNDFGKRDPLGDNKVARQAKGRDFPLYSAADNQVKDISSGNVQQQNEATMDHEEFKLSAALHQWERHVRNTMEQQLIEREELTRAVTAQRWLEEQQAKGLMSRTKTDTINKTS